MANQYLGQLEEMTPSGKSSKVLDAVFGNVGTIICFRVGAEDAEFLEREFMPEFVADDLVNLGKYNIYLRLMIDGLAGRPFSAETLPPFLKPTISGQEKIIKVSRERHATQRKIIEEKIARWSGVLESSEAVPSTAPPQRANPVLYDVQCCLCGRWTKVIFPPDGKRPVYCKSCLKKVEQEKETSGRPSERKKEEVKEEVKEENPPVISLEEATKSGPISFSPSKKVTTEKPKRKEVNIEELKKVLEEALKKDAEENQ